MGILKVMTTKRANRRTKLRMWRGLDLQAMHWKQNGENVTVQFLLQNWCSEKDIFKVHTTVVSLL